jgi:hypothetical protein
MIVILLAPSMAVLFHIFTSRLKVPRSIVFGLAAIVTLPLLLVWLTGYSFSSPQVNYIAVALALTAVLTALHAFDRGEHGGKIKAMLVLTLLLGIGITVNWMTRLIYAGRAKVYSQATYLDYKAIRSRDYSHGPERITVKKTRVFGWIEKVLVTETLNTRQTLAGCVFRFEDGSQAFEYNYCNNNIIPNSKRSRQD